MDNNINEPIDTLGSNEETINTQLQNNSAQDNETLAFNQQPIIDNNETINNDSNIDTLEPISEIETLDLNPSLVPGFNQTEQENKQLINEPLTSSFNQEQQTVSDNDKPVNNIINNSLGESNLDETMMSDNSQISEQEVENFDKPRKRVFVIDKESLYILVVALVLYFVIAPLVERHILEKIINNIWYVIAATKAGVSVNINIGLYIKIILVTFVVLGSFVFLLSSVINVVCCGKLFEEGRKFISKSMIICLLFSIVATVLLAQTDVDILSVIFRVATLDGYQMLLF